VLNISFVSENAEAFRNRLGEVLGAASIDAGYPFEPLPVDLVATLDAEEVGGLSGQLLYGWLWIMLLGVKPAFRRLNVGSTLLAKAESHAREQDALGMNVDTFAYQAPDFYRRHGFEEAQRLSGPVRALDRIYFVKTFQR